MTDFSYSEDSELQKLAAQVTAEPEEFEHWEKLVRHAEGQEGGLNRNSSPQAIAATRDTYDRFLARYPLFYGFWKRYADLEFSIGGTEAAEMVYERGVASIGTSVDLWANYCSFKTETTHDMDVIRELFERGAESCGQDFLAHPFWDKYVEFEERMEDRARVFDILSRLINMPLHQYSRYFERYITLSKDQPLDNVAPVNITSQLKAEVERAGAKPEDVERELRAKLEAYQWEKFNNTQAEVTKRWTYEQGIKRPYYHVTDLDEEQLTNWSKYLDFEEAEGDYARTKFLYERCLVTAANIDEFWFRYARWLAAQNGKQEEVRNVYQRASCIFVPISRPAIRLYYANFEESQDRVNIAIAIHEAILAHLPSHLETLKSLVNLHRRQYGVGAAVEVVKQYAESPDCNMQTRGALVAEWARIVWRSNGDTDGARKLFQSTQNQFLDCQPFWSSWLSFEIDQPSTESEEPSKHDRIKSVHQSIRQKSALPVNIVKLLSGRYIQYLEERGGKDTTTELLKLDVEINGPMSVQNQAAAGHMTEKNGHLP